MKRLLSLLGLLIIALSSFAQEFTIGDLTYSVLSQEDKTIRVINGQNANGDVVVPKMVTYDDVTYDVKEIGGFAFCQNNNITSISLPSVTSIGSDAFSGCSSLSSVSLPAATSIGSSAFYDCSSLSSISVPAATSIGNYAFYGCSSLSSVSLPAATSIGESAFSGCSSLVSASLPAATSIGNYAFYGCSSLSSVSLPTATSIGSSAFLGCSSLSSVSLPAVTSIGSSAFSGCSSLSSVSLPAATSIGESAFSGCSSLSSVSLPAATSIGSSAFSGCSSLSSVSLPAATSIGSYAFYDCSSLSSISVPAATSIGSYAFYLCSKINSLRISSVEQWCKMNFQGDYPNPLQVTSQSVHLYIGDSEIPATSIEIPNTVTEIPDYAFRKTTITSVSVPSATSIGSSAFSGCSSLTSVSLPAATSIESYAFQGCESLEKIIMPKVETIGEWAFGHLDNYDENDNWIGQTYCKSLAHLDLSSVKSIESYAFNGCSNISSLRIGSVDQWCQVNFGDYSAHPLQQISQAVTLYVGNSETPAKNLVASNSLTEIPNNAFYRISNIESLSAPAVTSIGGDAFSGCSSLSSVSLPATTSIGSSAFSGCSSLSFVSLPAATSIGSSAFYGCSSLSSVSLPAATSIGSYAFYMCSKINSLRIGSGEQWCKVNFQGGYANPLQVTSQSVDLYVCDSETPATSIEIPSTVAEIPDYAFRKTPITSVSAPSATSIGNYAFESCSSLSSVSLPAVTSIGSSAFSGCSSLSSVSLPAATLIGSHAFRDCESLEEAIMPKVETLGAYAFYTDNYNSEESRYMTSLKHVDLSSAKIIGEQAFYYCQELSRLELPEVRNIGEWAFYGSSLKYLSIPKVEEVGAYAFGDVRIDSLHIGSIEQYCNIRYQVNEGMDEWTYTCSFPFSDMYGSDKKSFLFIGDSNTPAEEIVIPASVKQIPDYAFNGTDIHTIHYEGTTPPTLTSLNAITDKMMLAVPDEAYETYLAADVYSTIPLQITKEGLITDTVSVEAKDNTSNLLAKIGKNNIRHIVNLKVNGTINSYDMLIIRNQMTSLRNLDLSDASIVDCDYVYSTTNGENYHSVKDVITADWLSGVMNLKLPKSTKSIADEAFKGCDRLVTVDIPEGVESIGREAFYYCSRIKNLELPQTVTSVGIQAFYGCTGLKEVVIPNGVTSVRSYAFEGCVDLEKVSIPASVTEIGNRSFNVNKPLTLHISSIDAWKDVNLYGSVWEYGPFHNVEKLYIGDSEEPVETIVIPEGTTRLKDFTFANFNCIKDVVLPATLDSIGNNTFRGCTGISTLSLPDSISHIGSYAFYNSGLTGINIPEKVKTINNYTFAYCGNLESVEFTDSLKSIGSYAFSGCNKLAKVELPAYLGIIGSYAFQNCEGLEEVLIPAGITEIQDYAFQGCSNLNRLIATTVEPIVINQNTFSTYRTANLYSPITSYDKYYWNTQWNQFLTINEYGENLGHDHYRYKYFYLRGHNGHNKEDFEIGDETGYIHGVKDKYTGKEKAPHADLHEGAGMIVGGEQEQRLGKVHLHHNGFGGASFIGKDKGRIHIDSLYVDIAVQQDQWYFFCFPFDIKSDNAKYDSSHVWYLYDGATRAANGNGGWKKLSAGETMKSGQGYIFQGAKAGTLTLFVEDVVIDTRDFKTDLVVHKSENKNDASWNLVGNLNLAYYDLDNIKYEAPITVYNNKTRNYEAVRSGDDDYEFYPFQAFFVQKPEDKQSVDFDGKKKDTKNQADRKKARKVAARANTPNEVDAERMVINLELKTDEMATDSVAIPSDRTRVVVNPAKSLGYETDCDAAKFIAENMPQIYTVDNADVIYSINERPAENGIINVAVKTPKDGVYVISALRMDCPAKLRDLSTGTVFDLSKGEYAFTAEATTYTERFQLILGGDATPVTSPEDVREAVSVMAGAINVNDPDADVTVYSVGGVLIASQKGAGSVKVPAGIYVVVVNGQSIKVTVKE